MSEGMLSEGRIAMSDAEHAAVDALQAQHGGNLSLTRSDPGDTGPVLVETSDGKTFQIAEDGTVTEL